MARLHLVKIVRWSLALFPTDILSANEINALFLNLRELYYFRLFSKLNLESIETLDAYTQRPDCFRNTVVALRNRCGEAEMTRSERVGGETPTNSETISLYPHSKAAISMTLCELATAKHHSPPLECFPFSSPSHEGEEVDEETQSICVGFVRIQSWFFTFLISCYGC